MVIQSVKGVFQTRMVDCSTTLASHGGSSCRLLEMFFIKSDPFFPGVNNAGVAWRPMKIKMRRPITSRHPPRSVFF